MISRLTAPQLMKHQILMDYHMLYDITKGPKIILDNIKGKTINADKIEKTWDAMVTTYRDHMKVNDYEGHSYFIRGFADIVRSYACFAPLIELDITLSGNFEGSVSAKVIEGKTVCWSKVDNQDFLKFPDSCCFMEDLIN
jgi:hypothetical protein